MGGIQTPECWEEIFSHLFFFFFFSASALHCIGMWLLTFCTKGQRLPLRVTLCWFNDLFSLSKCRCNLSSAAEEHNQRQAMSSQQCSRPFHYLGTAHGLTLCLWNMSRSVPLTFELVKTRAEKKNPKIAFKSSPFTVLWNHTTMLTFILRKSDRPVVTTYIWLMWRSISQVLVTTEQTAVDYTQEHRYLCIISKCDCGKNLMTVTKNVEEVVSDEKRS